MFGKNLLLKVLPLTGALLLAGCADKSTGPAATATDTNRQVFQVKGLLKELKQNGKTVVIAHEEIPNYMVAMTMDFDVKDKNELKGLQPNDYLAFQMVVTKDDGWIENLRKVPAPAPADAGKGITINGTNDTNAVTFRRSPIVEPLSLGDKVPDYKFTNQFGTPISLAQYQGRALGVTFIFTRCPFPTFCPRMSQNFDKAQKLLKSMAGAPINWTLLSISFDPAFDTPERLKKYSEPYSADQDHWQFVTSDLWTVDGITEQFGLTFYRESPAALPNHNLRTVVIDTRGRVQKIFSGNEWTAEELAAEMMKAATVK